MLTYYTNAKWGTEVKVLQKIEKNVVKRAPVKAQTMGNHVES